MHVYLNICTLTTNLFHNYKLKKKKKEFANRQKEVGKNLSIVLFILEFIYEHILQLFGYQLE